MRLRVLLTLLLLSRNRNIFEIYPQQHKKKDQRKKNICPSVAES